MWKWNENLEYIKSNKGLISEKIYEAISNEKLYSPEFRDSLHDRRLTKVGIHNGEIEDFISKKDIDKNITIMLVGAYYGRYHLVRYKEVKNYYLNGGLDDSDLYRALFFYRWQFHCPYAYFSISLGQIPRRLLRKLIG